MNIANAYTEWAATYDACANPTRDLDGQALRSLMGSDRLGWVVEAGCGTGKNTRYFAQMAQRVHALDFSAGMLDVARRSAAAPHVQFDEADLSAVWPCASGCADLVSFNLVLEHIDNLAPVFGEAARVLRPGGRVLVSELHPFKQYQSSQARFLSAAGVEVKVPAFTHHVSDYLAAAALCGLQLLRLDEWWHMDDPRSGVPRLLTLLLQRLPLAGAGVV